MSISIELGFDADSVRKLGALSAMLRDSFGGMEIARSPAEHHTSLALLPKDSNPPVESLVRSVLAEPAFPLSFAQAAAFDSREGVVYLAPERSPKQAERWSVGRQT